MPFGIDDAVMLVLGAIKVYNALTEKTIEAEQDPEIQGADAKRIHVEQATINEIDALELPDALKTELKRNITSTIATTVKTFNDKGIFTHREK